MNKIEIGDKVFVINWNKIYSCFNHYIDNERISVFGWKTQIPNYSGIEHHWKFEYEPNLTLKGTVNKREPKKLKSKTPVYKDYKYEVLEIIQHPNHPEVNICLLSSTHTNKEWIKCYVQVSEDALSFLTPEQFADEQFNALKEFHKGKYAIEGPIPFKELPEQFISKVYDVDDNVLFGSRYIKGKVSYNYIDGFFTKDGIPIIMNASIDYDGIGNVDLPEGSILMQFDNLHKMFPNNKFEK